MDIPVLAPSSRDHETIAKLHDMEERDRRKLRSKVFNVRDSDTTWRSWTVREHIYKKNRNGLPTQARGLFTLDDVNAQYPIVVRGYNKFFNLHETDTTQWPSLKSDTKGPYYATAKENGCIIFIGALNASTVVVTSKHTIPIPQDDPTMHGGVGYRWLLRHLESVNLKESDLAAWIYKHKVTLVAELCDDQFEEHVLRYDPKESGLYMHGVNYNTSTLRTLEFEKVQEIARHFGFRSIDYDKYDSLDEIKALADQIAESGKYKNRDIEGIVIRCKRDDKDFFFKIKNDHYLLFREYREITKGMIDVKDDQVSLKKDGKRPRCSYEKSVYYVQWLQIQVKEHPEWFKEYKNNKGILDVRERFEKFWDSGELHTLKGDPIDIIDTSKRDAWK
ncbi:tRNA ligase [Lichtheimia hyalospora FSU 10163]|nr:tRNA ligase [Lichtheimia hyalospora FSU 10163]